METVFLTLCAKQASFVKEDTGVPINSLPAQQREPAKIIPLYPAPVQPKKLAKIISLFG